MRHAVALALVVVWVLAAIPCSAHETRPFYLEIKEVAQNRYTVIWREPLYYGRRLPVVLQLPDQVTYLSKPEVREYPDSIVQRLEIDGGEQGLKGQRIVFPGLQVLITDVLVRTTLYDGSQWTRMVKPSQPWIEFKGSLGRLEAAKAYLRMGVEHILLGVDHLLFVLGLLLLSRGYALLVKTITAFTVGHSISLAMATLGMVSVPAKPLSAAIALSIVFMAAELVRAKRGQTTLTIQFPWLVSLGFGLLHGLGFAGALTALGLPASAIPLALLLFNVGVEIGQIIFVAVVLLLLASLRKLELNLPVWAEPLPVYAMGSVAAFWFVGRFMVFF